MKLTEHDKKRAGMGDKSPKQKRPVRYPGLYQAARDAGLNPRMVWARVATGWTREDALTIPARQKSLSPEDAAWRQNLLKSVLETHGLKQKELAEMLMVRRSIISKWKYGRQPIPASRVTVLSHLLETGSMP